MIVASLFAVIVTIFFVMLPFISLTIVSTSYKTIKSEDFQKSYGTLTEGVCLEDNLYKTSYYSLFMFQRIIFGGILVLLYTQPFTQLILFMILHIAMILYIGCAKSFADFGQRTSMILDEASILIFLAYAMVILERPRM